MLSTHENRFLDNCCFGNALLTPAILWVSHENYQSSTPPMRNLDVSGEILTLLKTHTMKTTLQGVFDQESVRPL